MRRVSEHRRRRSGSFATEDGMRPFTYTRATSVDDALAAIRGKSDAKLLGGGTNLVDLMKIGVDRPALFVHVTLLPLAKIDDHSRGAPICAMDTNKHTPSNL